MRAALRHPDPLSPRSAVDASALGYRGAASLCRRGCRYAGAAAGRECRGSSLPLPSIPPLARRHAHDASVIATSANASEIDLIVRRLAGGRRTRGAFALRAARRLLLRCRGYLVPVSRCAAAGRCAGPRLICDHPSTSPTLRLRHPFDRSGSHPACGAPTSTSILSVSAPRGVAPTRHLLLYGPLAMRASTMFADFRNDDI